MNVLVDTSVWSLALRRKREALSVVEQALVDELTELVHEGRVRMLGVIRQELLSGVRTGEQFDKLRTVLRNFPDEPIGTADYEAAAEMGNSCRSKGITVSVVDMLICQLAVARRWLLFTIDTDFQHYAKVLPLKLHLPRT